MLTAIYFLIYASSVFGLWLTAQSYLEGKMHGFLSFGLGIVCFIACSFGLWSWLDRICF